MRSRPSAAVAALLIATVLLVAGCAAGGSGTGTGGAAQGTTAAPSPTETFDSPAPEPTTPDTSRETSSNHNPAISVARLPIGGDAQDDGTDPRLQCAHITWIAGHDGQVPRGTAVEITRITFTPAAFKAVRGGCGAGRPSCLGYIFRSSTLQCDLAVRATGTVPGDANPSVGFAGLVFCPDNASAACTRFVRALAHEQQLTVSLNVPQLPPPPSDTPTDTTTSDTTTSGTTTSGSG